MWIYSAHPAPRQNLFRKCREWSGREDPDSCPSLHRNGHSIKRGSREKQNGGLEWNSAKEKNQSNRMSKWGRPSGKTQPNLFYSRHRVKIPKWRRTKMNIQNKAEWKKTKNARKGQTRTSRQAKKFYKQRKINPPLKSFKWEIWLSILLFSERFFWRMW